MSDKRELVGAEEALDKLESVLVENDLAQVAALRRMNARHGQERIDAAAEAQALAARGLFLLAAAREAKFVGMRVDDDCQCATCLQIRKNAERAAKVRCGKYVGDNDGTCPQLTCVLKPGHLGDCDNVHS